MNMAIGLVSEVDVFDTLYSNDAEKKFDSENSQSFFVTNSNGLQTNRDAWVYNFSKKTVDKMSKII